MKTSLARRYAPLALVLAIQLLIITLVPSKPGGGGGLDQYANGDSGATGTGTAAGAGAGGSVQYDAQTGQYIDTKTGKGVKSAGGSSGGGGSASSGGGGGTNSSGGGTDNAGAPGGPTVAAGDTSHCVAGRQFNPGLSYYAPPCVPKWPKGANNGGATYMGVT